MYITKGSFAGLSYLDSRLLNEVNFSNIRGGAAFFSFFLAQRFSLSLRLVWHSVRAHHIFLY